MTKNISFVRKVIYVAAIAVLLIPLFLLGQPASYNKAEGGQSGGLLARLRAEHNLSQAELGEIDPASESMKLATLGMRGVAANILWNKAVEYKKRKQWDSLSATVNQIIKLQPNFIKVWEFQGHNLSYNVSVEFDDYRHRYHWVKKGIDFLIQGTGYNRDEPRLLQYVGWFFGQKIGRADEHVQFRQMFRDDRDYHNFLMDYVNLDRQEARGRHDQLPDNWLVSRLWYVKAQTAVDTLGKSLRGKSPLIFNVHTPMSLINYAEAIESEGHFGEVAQNAWNDADVELEAFGRRLIPTSWGVSIRLNDIDVVRKETARLEQALQELAPGAREQVVAERVAALDEDSRRVWTMPEPLRIDRFSSEDWDRFYALRQEMLVSNADIADRSPGENREQALAVARKLNKLEVDRARIGSYRQQVNLDYWQSRCEVEQTELAANAREYVYLAEQDWEEAKLEQAKEKFEKGWNAWSELFEQFPEVKSPQTRQDLENALEKYQVTLSQLGEKLPPDFKLQWMLEERYGIEENPDDPRTGATTGDGTPDGDESAADPADAAAEPSPGEPDEDAAETTPEPSSR